MTLARSLTRQGGVAGALAVIGAVTAVLVAAISAVQMALDGVALKATIDTWTNASQAADKASAYQVAVGMRVGSVFCAAGRRRSTETPRHIRRLRQKWVRIMPATGPDVPRVTGPTPLPSTSLRRLAQY